MSENDADEVMTPKRRAEQRADEDRRRVEIGHFESIMEEAMGHLRDALRMSGVARSRDPKIEDRVNIYYAMQRCNDALLRASEKWTEVF